MAPDGRTVYLGTAGGGVWKTDDITAAQPGLARDRRRHPQLGDRLLDAGSRHVYVGTGEPNGSSDSEAGPGLFASTDGGQHFTQVTGFHSTRGPQRLLDRGRPERRASTCWSGPRWPATGRRRSTADG